MGTNAASESTEIETPSTDDVLGVLARTLRYARVRDYTGWDYGDGMSSKILQTLPVDNKWLNLAVQEGIKRAPVNVRPYLLVEQRRNFKGTALFTLANLNASRLAANVSVPGDATETAYEAEARDLATWLVNHQTPGYAGFCGAHRHQIQWLNRMGQPDDPDVVSTSYGVNALLRASSIKPCFATTALTAADFVFDDLEYAEEPPGARIKYVPAHGTDHYTLNAVALGARLLVDLYEYAGWEVLRERAKKLLEYVVSNQTVAGGWMYRDPPSTSHLSMDNHHNGFILECLRRYHAVTDSAEFEAAFERGLEFYRRELFTDDGAPNFSNEQTYPRDIHGAAQGILVFTKTGNLPFATRILNWTLENLYGGDGQFYFQQRRFYTKRFTLMRWCQAWMAYALSTYLVHRTGLERTARPTRTGEAADVPIPITE